jgi:hypothetical protein
MVFPQQNLIAVFTGWDILNEGDIMPLVPRLLAAVKAAACPGPTQVKWPDGKTIRFKKIQIRANRLEAWLRADHGQTGSYRLVRRGLVPRNALVLI